jgi:hypothetical protein
MKLRKSKALKFFAILLFSFEMIAPALIPTVEAELLSNNFEGKSWSNATHHTGFLSSFLFEENTGEEEERESKDKHTIYFIDLSFDQLIIELGTPGTRHTSWTEPHKKSASQPPLFTLLHKYLI